MSNYIVFAVILIFTLLKNNVRGSEPELQLINVVFRHGQRTPLIPTIYPNDPYKNVTFFPEGFGALTNKGKTKSYELGQILRQRYNDFLGDTYIPENVFARSTDSHRTKMTLQLVLAGLYPPNSRQKWNKFLNWQPIPTTYVSKYQDELYEKFSHCKKLNKHYSEVEQIPEVAKEISSLDNLMKNLTYYTGHKIIKMSSLIDLYGHFLTQHEMGFQLPSWTKGIFPQGQLLDGVLKAIEILNYDDELKRFHGGVYLRKISKSMIGLKNGSEKSKNKKIYLYSSHDFAIGGIIAALNLKNMQFPYFCSTIIVELLKNDETYYVKILHYLGQPSRIEILQIPNCAQLCPLEDFLRLTKHVIPTDDNLKCL